MLHKEVLNARYETAQLSIFILLVFSLVSLSNYQIMIQNVLLSLGFSKSEYSYTLLLLFTSKALTSKFESSILFLMFSFFV